MSAEPEPVDLTPYIKSVDFQTSFPPGTFSAAVPGLKVNHTVTISGPYMATWTPDQVASLFEVPEHMVADPLDEALKAAGITDTTPSHWQRIHRARSFEAEQNATRKRLAAQWEPGKSERELS